MILQKIKLLIGIFILLAYMGIGVFGLFKFNHMSADPMTNCPYAENGFSVCQNSIEHLNDWHQFSNVVFASLFIFSIMALGLVLYFLNRQNFLKQRRYFYEWKYYLYNKKLYVYLQEIIKWLSLFENSPSIYIRA